MKLKLLTLAVAAAFSVGAQASVPIASGGVAATIHDNGSFDSSATPGLSYMGVEFVNIDSPSSWWVFGKDPASWTVAQFNAGGIPGSATYPAGPAASTTLAFGSLSFFQTASIVSSNQLAYAVSFTNNGPTALTGMYYGVGIDPDQGGSTRNETYNTVNAQGSGASVTAVRDNGRLNYSVTLANTTSAAAVEILAYVNLGDCCSWVNPQTVHAAAIPQLGYQGYADDSISLAYDLGTIAPGQTVQVGYSYTFATTPVPEPESYAMFLAGLGLMGFMARRRTRV